jgi:hypothetical protein
MPPWLALALLPAFCLAQDTPPEDVGAHFETTVFGTTAVSNSGLRGQIYFISANALRLPKFEKLKPVGTIYTNSLNIPPREFTDGFPGVTKRFEWFAIDYTGRFWIAKPGKYQFALASDDGSKLYIDGREVIDNDGIHGTLRVDKTLHLETGIHTIRISYFQGPRFSIALMLGVAGPGDRDMLVFNTDNFKPPADWDGKDK